jgi:uncharacterized protein YcbK (DUF882 family)
MQKRKDDHLIHIPEHRIKSTRRGFLKCCAGAAMGVIATPALAKRAGAAERSLSFYNIHTGERVTTTYWAHGSYVTEGLAEISHVLRDYRTGDVMPMDPRLMDLLHTLKDRVDSDGHFHVISGYRSPATNSMLRAHSSGVAKHSLHMDGKAIDIRLPDCKLKHLQRAALSLRAGGVGYYPRSNFVHVDVGRVRHWGASV